MTTQTIERPAQRTCASCPYFQSFDEPNGRGWCHAFDHMAQEYHSRTAACDTEIEALEKEAQQQAELEPEQEPVSNAWDDAASYQLQTVQETETEFEQGRTHGQNDAESGWLPIYTAPLTSYAKGYLEGYSAVLNPTTQLEQVSAPQEWSVSYDSKWDWYRAYVGSRCIGHGTTHQEAERIAQRYIAVNEIIQRQNAAVMKAYAC